MDKRGLPQAAGTVHAIGPFEELVAAERNINSGRMPERRLSWSVSSTSRIRRAHPAISIRSGAYAHVPAATTGTRPARSSARSRDSPRDSASGSSRWRRAHRPIWRRSTRTTSAVTSSPARHAGAGPDQAASRPRPVQHGDPGHLHLLGVDSARSRRARDERVQRRPIRAQTFGQGRCNDLVLSSSPRVLPVLPHVVPTGAVEW